MIDLPTLTLGEVTTWQEADQYAPYDDLDSYRTIQERQELEQAINRCNLQYIGVGARTSVVINHTIIPISTGGVWGIEDWLDNRNDAYILEIEIEQLRELKDLLATLNPAIELTAVVEAMEEKQRQRTKLQTAHR